ncbi:MAG: Ribosomal RNA small subunit methyltransferase I [Syntrophomonadaceae bacterium]|nr:Ribosomal RNA small subunit methyltransferase I [Bacillota bacterium]
MNQGTLYLCPTPLGNLEDITLRVLRVLRESALVAAEDTRVTRKLLNHFDIHTRLVSYHEHNKAKQTPYLIGCLLDGRDVALVSDAGMPGIADPGEALVRAAVSKQVRVVALPGPVAAVTALAASGLPSASFEFFGFLPSRGAKRKEMMEAILSAGKTAIFYEAPHRLAGTLADLAAFAGHRPAVVARELTKIHEEFVRGSLQELAQHFVVQAPRGECTVLLAPAEIGQIPVVSAQPLVDKLLSLGLCKKEAALAAADILGLPKRQVYNLIHQKR